MKTSPPRKNSAPSQMNSILASASCVLPCLDVIAIGALATERALQPIADAITSLSTPPPPNAEVKQSHAV
jgi:hypothetical protein